MHKHLIFGAVLFIGSAGIMAGQPNKATDGKQQPAADQKPAVVVRNTPNKQPDSGTNQAKPSSNPPAGNTPVDGRKIWWQDSNWALVLIGLITAGVIGWQSWETRKAAEATAKSIILQEIAFHQWVEIRDWSVEDDSQGARKRLRIAVNCVNPTDYPISVLAATVTLVGGSTPVSRALATLTSLLEFRNHLSFMPTSRISNTTSSIRADGSLLR